MKTADWRRDDRSTETDWNVDKLTVRTTSVTAAPERARKQLITHWIRITGQEVDGEKTLVCSHYLKLQCHSVMAKNSRLHRGKTPTKPLEDEAKEINHSIPGILLLISFPCSQQFFCLLVSLIEPHPKIFSRDDMTSQGRNDPTDSHLPEIVH